MSQLAEPLWTDPGIKSGISVYELISTLKSTGGQGMVKHYPQTLASEEKATTTTTVVQIFRAQNCNIQGGLKCLSDLNDSAS